MVENQLLIQDQTSGDVQLRVHEQGVELFGFLCELFWPFVDSYWLAGAALFTLQPSRSLVERVLVERMQWFAEKLYSERIVLFYDCCNKDSIRCALAIFRHWNVVQLNESSAVELTEQFKNQRVLLDFVEKLSLFRTPNAVYATTESLAQRLGVPFLARL